MPSEALPDLSIVLTFLRCGQGWSQADLAAAAGISPKILNDYERGRKRLTRERLVYLIAFLGLPPETIESTLGLLATHRALGRTPRDSTDPRSGTRRRAEALAIRFGTLATGFARESLSTPSPTGRASNDPTDRSCSPRRCSGLGGRGWANTGPRGRSRTLL